MQVIEEGHVYELDQLDGDGVETLRFVNREATSEPHPGTQTQEVLRALIDRTMHCDNCLRWEGNDLIIHHLRMALVLHEARALIRKTQKGLILPEQLATARDGHFLLGPAHRFSQDAATYHTKPKPDSPLRGYGDSLEGS